MAKTFSNDVEMYEALELDTLDGKRIPLLVVDKTNNGVVVIDLEGRRIFLKDENVEK